MEDQDVLSFYIGQNKYSSSVAMYKKVLSNIEKKREEDRIFNKSKIK